MSDPSRRRAALFGAVSTVLIAFAVLLARAPQPQDSLRERAPSSPVGVGRGSLDLLEGARREEARLRVAGRRFVSAFLRREVGDLSPRVEADLRRYAAPALVQQLASAPLPGPLDPHRSAAARIERLEVSFLSEGARRALLSGVARRPDGPEEFSFLFARRGGRWRAIGAAE